MLQAEAILEEMAKFAQNVTHPLTVLVMKKALVGKTVFTPAGFKEAFRQYAEGGWIGLGADEEWGGQACQKC
jgi:alkylation response protein AidB-like acyl-CoA dehydrogenase